MSLTAKPLQLPWNESVLHKLIIGRAENHLPSLDLISGKGSYLLGMVLTPAQILRIGSLGEHRFAAGCYLYAGSARGSGGLRARLNHHLRPAQHPHWHVDYVRTAAQVEVIWWMEGADHECVWSQALASAPEGSIPLAGLGASDCRNGCPAHLIGWQGEWEQVDCYLRIAISG